METAAMKNSKLPADRHFNICKELCHRSLRLVQDLLYSQKLGNNEQSAIITEFDIGKILTTYKDNFNLRANTKKIKLQFKIDQTPTTCMLDISKWHRIIENLFNNALKYTHPGGKIIISSKKIGNKVEVRIKDTGIGIDSKDIPKLFNRFSELGKKGTAGEASTGLGLYIVKSLVEIHHGKIDVVSKVGKGTEFILELPCVE